MIIKLEFSHKNFEKYSNITFHENPFVGSRVVIFGLTDRQTDMTTLIISFRNFANGPEKSYMIAEW
jgi:hypothetical protein